MTATRGKLGRFVDTGLKPGDRCYKVVLHIQPDDKPDEWRVESRTIKTASERMITFEGERYNFGSSRRQWSPTSLGSYFFRTPREAVEAFRVARLEEIKVLHRRIDEAAQAIAWADGQLAAEEVKP